MKKPNISPGPWGIRSDVLPPVLERIDCISHSGGPICGTFLNWLTPGMNVANAQAIAAVPDLIEALIAARTEIIALTAASGGGLMTEKALKASEQALLKAGCTE
jgi:hypothetical protein